MAFSLFALPLPWISNADGFYVSCVSWFTQLTWSKDYLRFLNVRCLEFSMILRSHNLTPPKKKHTTYNKAIWGKHGKVLCSKSQCGIRTRLTSRISQQTGQLTTDTFQKGCCDAATDVVSRSLSEPITFLLSLWEHLKIQPGNTFFRITRFIYPAKYILEGPKTCTSQNSLFHFARRQLG